MKKKISVSVFAAVLAGVMFFTTACTLPAWVSTVESIAATAVPIAGSIVDIVDPLLAPAVTAVEGGFTAITNTLNTYKASPTATNLQSVESALASLEANEAALEKVAGTSTSNNAEINGVLALISQAVTEIAADLPATPATAAFKANAAILKSQPKAWKSADFKRAYNKLIKNDARLKPLHISLRERL